MRNGALIRRALATVLAASLTPTAAWAHGGAATPGHLWADWAPPPAALLGLLALGALYLRGTRAVWHAAGRGRGVTRGAAICFGLGWATLALAVASPLDGLADALFSAHMVQHLLLIAVAPPLLLLGRPVIALLWAAPRVSRRLRGWRARVPGPLVTAAGAAASAVAAPPSVWLLHTVTLWLWHLPGPYQAALRSEAVHGLEHLTFLGTALLVWAVALAPGGQRRERRAIGALLVFATGVQGGLLGALLTLAPRVWYPVQAAGAAAWGLTPLEDQQLAGLIMWVPGGLIYVAAATLLVGVWLEHRTPPRRIRPVPGGIALLSLVLLGGVALAGCRSDDATSNVPGGDPARGKVALSEFGCGACHTIDGLRGARGVVGPPLTDIGRRTMIAGQVPNTPANMIRWIRDPQAIEPGTAMPNLGVGEQTARDIAAYLSTRR